MVSIYIAYTLLINLHDVVTGICFTYSWRHTPTKVAPFLLFKQITFANVNKAAFVLIHTNLLKIKSLVWRTVTVSKTKVKFGRTKSKREIFHSIVMNYYKCSIVTFVCFTCCITLILPWSHFKLILSTCFIHCKGTL